MNLYQSALCFYSTSEKLEREGEVYSLHKMRYETAEHHGIKLQSSSEVKVQLKEQMRLSRSLDFKEYKVRV